MEDRLQLADATLRHAMLAILGPRAINEEKFSQWETRLNALGLTWDTANRTVSMPVDKIAKALDRVRKLKQSKTVMKSDLLKLLGSLRHICSCLRTARPFYQHLQSLCNRSPRHGVVKLSAGAKTDLDWFEHILSVGHLKELQLSIFGSREPTAQLHLYIDASDMGLAVLNPSANEFIQIAFDSEETKWIVADSKSNKFSINVREHMCIALALWIWGPTWTSLYPDQTVVVKCWSDNRAAVVWSNSLASTNELSQEVNHAIGLAEALFNVRVIASHLPGSTNIAADAASRA
ncbi:unnamed protein product [Phytophthora fragariaefolia]|uniref:Unnamed protein product n=1 Tax=Phytophthora fragariaefolia TaxID=1490495 RepID=A0A9W6XPQ0_9STRA|nr:unnamed protein product [Phytophthora fragariaefolia]